MHLLGLMGRLNKRAIQPCRVCQTGKGLNVANRERIFGFLPKPRAACFPSVNHKKKVLHFDQRSLFAARIVAMNMPLQEMLLMKFAQCKRSGSAQLAKPREIFASGRCKGLSSQPDGLTGHGSGMALGAVL